MHQTDTAKGGYNMPLYENVFLVRPDVSASQVEALTKEFTRNRLAVFWVSLASKSPGNCHAESRDQEAFGAASKEMLQTCSPLRVSSVRLKPTRS